MSGRGKGGVVARKKKREERDDEFEVLERSRMEYEQTCYSGDELLAQAECVKAGLQTEVDRERF